MTILPYALGIGLIAITLSMFLCLIRLIIGPSVIDRLLALDTLFLNATCLVVVLGIYWVSNNMFEGALLVAAEKYGLDISQIRHTQPRVAELPFDSIRSWMITCHQQPEGRYLWLQRYAGGRLLANLPCG